MTGLENKAPAASGCPFARSEAALMDPQVQRAPNAFYRWLRASHPVYWAESMQMFIVSSAALIREAAEDPTRFSSVGSQDFPRESPLCPAAAAIRATTYATKPLTVVLDPPEHTQYRKIMNGALSIPRMRAARPLVERLVSELLGRMMAKGGGDMVEEFSVALPFTLITVLMGLPEEMAPTVRKWARAYVDNLVGHGPDARQIECAQSYAEFHQYVAQMIQQRRAAEQPPDDLVTGIALAKLDNGELLPMTEALALVEQFVVAGADTTTNVLSMGMLMLARHPDLMTMLHENPESAESFAEEMLRMHAPAQGLFRAATRDTELGGVAIPQGSRLMLRWGAGNSDESTFAQPDELDLTRPNAHQHFTFGHGPHKCQGATLARIELSTAFRTIAQLVEKIVIEDEARDVEHIQAPTFMGLLRLNVSLPPRNVQKNLHLDQAGAINPHN